MGWGEHEAVLVYGFRNFVDAFDDYEFDLVVQQVLDAKHSELDAGNGCDSGDSEESDGDDLDDRDLRNFLTCTSYPLCLIRNFAVGSCKGGVYGGVWGVAVPTPLADAKAATSVHVAVPASTQQYVYEVFHAVHEKVANAATASGSPLTNEAEEANAPSLRLCLNGDTSPEPGSRWPL